MKIYVASSWKNPMQIAVVKVCETAGYDVYDFKAKGGFHWKDVDVDSGGCNYDDYIKGLNKDRAIAGFNRDFNNMLESDRCILVLPCNRSAHLEAGWFIGQGKPTAIYIPDGMFETPELMYKMASLITDNMIDLLSWLGVQD